MGNAAPVVNIELHREDGWSTFPSLGMRMAFLEDFIESCGGREQLKGLSTAAVCERFIKTKTSADKVSMCEMLRRQGNPAVGLASVYVIHCWSAKFLDTMQALADHFKHMPDVVLWMDIFSFNQFHSANLANVDISHGMARCGRTVLVVDPAHPLVLHRTWCLYEIWCSSRCDGIFEFAMTSTQRQTLLRDLTADLQFVQRLTAKADVILSECAKFEDRDSILTIIEDSVGYSTANAAIVKHLRTALISFCEEHCKELESNKRARLRLRNALADLYLAQNKLYLAEGTYFDCLVESKNLLGARHPATLHVMHQLAAVYEREGRLDLAEVVEGLYLQCVEESQQEGVMHDSAAPLSLLGGLARLFLAMRKYDQAELLLLETLAKTKESVGLYHPDYLETMDSLITLYMSTGRLREAETNLKECLAAKCQMHGNLGASTLQSTLTLAAVYSAQQKFYPAEGLLLSTLKMIRSQRGEDSDDALTFMHRLASLYFVQGRMDVAEPYLQACFDRSVERYGMDHHNTLAAMNNLAVFHVRCGALSTAEALFTDCLSKRRALFGEKHPDTVDVMRNLSGLYATMSSTAR